MGSALAAGLCRSGRQVTFGVCDTSAASPQTTIDKRYGQSTKNNSRGSGRRFLTHKQVPPAQLVLLLIVRAEDWRRRPRGLKKQTRSISPEVGKQSPVCF